MRSRTADPHTASVMLYQLSYNPEFEIKYKQKKTLLQGFFLFLLSKSLNAYRFD